MSEQHIPCDEALSAMPGDKIKFLGGEHFETVVSGAFEPGPKKGKIYTYYTAEGSKVPYELVTKVMFIEPIRLKPLGDEASKKYCEMLEDLESKLAFLKNLRELEIEDEIKIAIYSIIKGGLDDLLFANEVLSKKIENIKKQI